MRKEDQAHASTPDLALDSVFAETDAGLEGWEIQIVILPAAVRDYFGV